MNAIILTNTITTVTPAVTSAVTPAVTSAVTPKVHNIHGAQRSDAAYSLVIKVALPY